MIIYSKSVIDRMVFDLIMQIRVSQQKFSSVVGIANGGLYISKCVAQHLFLRHSMIRISYYDSKHHTRPRPLIDCPVIKHNSLIVDDLVDSGKTLKTFRDIYGHSHKFAVLFSNSGVQIPDFYVKTKPNNWIVFPWE